MTAASAECANFADADDSSVTSFYDGAFVRLRKQLLEDSSDLVTRRFLRAERWLEYTLQHLCDLVIREAKIRSSLEALETRERCSMDVHALRLQALVDEGTQGTIIEVEELEREVRYRVLLFEEVADRESLEEATFDDRISTRVREARRCERELHARLALCDEEGNARWNIAEAEHEPRFVLSRQLEHDTDQLFGLLRWRVIVKETDLRYSIEHEEEDARQACVASQPSLLWSLATANASEAPSAAIPSDGTSRAANERTGSDAPANAEFSSTRVAVTGTARGEPASDFVRLAALVAADSLQIERCADPASENDLSALRPAASLVVSGGEESQPHSHVARSNPEDDFSDCEKRYTAVEVAALWNDLHL